MGDSRDSGEGASTLLEKKREFLESFFKKGAELTRELLKENDRLRRRLVQLEDELAARGRPSPSQSTLDELLAKLHALEEEKRHLIARVEAVEADGRRFSGRYEEIERESSDLASLFVAQGQLHATLDAGEVVRVIIEILINFVGAQRFALMAPAGDGTLRVLATEGVDPATMTAIAPGKDEGVISHVASSQTLHIEHDAPAYRREPGEQEPTICFPLPVAGDLVGVIAIWCFLTQKEELEPLDRRIFDLLWQSGGRALEAARLAARARRGHEPGQGRFEEYQALLS